MIRLNEPTYTFAQVLEECSIGITGNSQLLKKISQSKANLIAQEDLYLTASNNQGLCTIHPIITANDENPTIVNDLTKSELIRLYDRYFVNTEKPARKIYDSLLNSAQERCPYCGGIGTPRNLDHFLPKAHFPQFSILPKNLVPACRDCNMEGKAQNFATSLADQVIQPYIDNDRFFQEQWIFANYHNTDQSEPGFFEYYVQAPEGWPEVDKQRANKHFNDFNLAKRYAIKAAEHLGTILLQIQKSKEKGCNQDEINSILIDPGIDAAPFVNHWQRGQYQALKISNLGL